MCLGEAVTYVLEHSFAMLTRGAAGAAPLATILCPFGAKNGAIQKIFSGMPDFFL